MQSTNLDVVKLFLRHLGRYKAMALFALFFSIAVNLIELVWPWFYKFLLDILTAADLPLEDRISRAVPILIAILLAKTGVQACWRCLDWTLIQLEARVMGDTAYTCFKYLERHSYQFFSNAFTGSLVRKSNRLVRGFEDLTDTLSYNLFPQVVLTLGTVGIITWKQPTIGAILAVWVVLYVSANIFLFSKVQKYNLLRAEKDSQVTGVLSDSLSNNVNVKLFARYGHEEKRMETVLDEWRKLTIKGWTMNMLPAIVGGFSFGVLEFAVMYTALGLFGQGKLTVGDFVLFQGYLTILFGKLWMLQRIMKGLYQTFSDSREMVDILLEPHEVQDAKRAKALAVSRGGIGFSDVSFSYNQTRTVFKDFNLEIKPGEHVALVGPSGSGKSTIVKLLFRFYDLDKGKILVDGQKISAVTQDSLRENVALVPQDPVLFHRTLMENIRYGRLDATDEEVYAAAKKANCHDFIMSLSSGYDTYVGERGIKLSGGERQRVAIARAILKNAPILVLDEATSSLDSESEALIQDALKTLMRGKTSIVIAHRLSTIMQMDRIVVMEEGRIIDQGTHAELLKRQGMYKKLWEIQAGGFLP